jgi:hypothetical protein
MRPSSINGLAKFFNRLHHSLTAKYVDAGPLVHQRAATPQCSVLILQPIPDKSQHVRKKSWLNRGGACGLKMPLPQAQPGGNG